jgi:quercetin dioxygenase-like cupin family protein
MTRAGDVIVNPATGDKIKFLKTARETKGELLQFQEWLKVGGVGPPEHIHPRQEEHFLVVKGTMGVSLNKKEHILKEGQEITVPRGAAHRWWNAGDVELDHISEFRPALRFDAFLQTLFALGREKNTYKGIPLILQFAVVSGENPDNVYVTELPVGVQKVLYKLLIPVTAALGYRKRYFKYGAPR